MTRAEETAIVVRLACEVADRTKEEQRALRNVASRVDDEINRQTTNNPHTKDQPYTACDYTPDHRKGCKCWNRDGRPQRVQVPRGGWSRLVSQVDETWGAA